MKQWRDELTFLLLSIEVVLVSLRAPAVSDVAVVLPVLPRTIGRELLEDRRKLEKARIKRERDKCELRRIDRVLMPKGSWIWEECTAAANIKPRHNII